MPLKRYEIRNEYSLADPELYKVADKDDPEAILEGVAMAGLVGVLRQLGDLAEFAAEIFHDLHEEVMSTAARGHGLIARVQQVEAEFPAIERKLLSQTSHTSFLYNSSIDWHSNPRLDENTITQGGLPRFVMDSYEECRGPPRLFLLDKFDVAGAGACLKRFTDPSFFKMGSAGGKLERQREKKNRKVKKRGAHLKNGEPPESFPSSHAKLHQLFLEERIENGGSDHDRRVKLKKRQFTGTLFDHESTKSYMENFLDTCPLEQRIVREFDPLPLTWTSNNASESSLEIVESGTGSPVKESTQYDQDICSSPDVGDIVVKPSIDDSNGGKSNDCVNNEALKVLAVNSSTYVNNIPSSTAEVVNSEDFADRERKKADCFNNGYDSDDVASEIDGYVDALASMESEVDTDSDRKKYTSYMNRNPVMVDSDESFERQELQGGYLDSQSVGNSATSEDNFRERTNSSRSNSVTAFAENTADFDMVASDNDNKFSGGHLVSKKISDNEAEEHAMAHVSDLKVNGGPKDAGEFDDVSDTSSLTDPNSKVLSTGRETRLIEYYDDVYPNSSGNDVASGERDQRHAFNGSVPGFVEKANNENLSGEHSILEVAGHISSVDSDTSPDAQDTSPQIQSFNNGHSACSPFEEQNTDIFKTSNSGGSKLSSPGNSEASEIVRSASFVARIDSSENIPRSVVATTLDDGEFLDDYLMLGKPSSSSQDLLAEEMPQKVKSEENDADGYSFSKGDPVSDGEVGASANILESDTACHDFMPTSPDQTEDVKSKAQLDHSLTDAVVTLAGSDHDCSEQMGDGNKVFSNEAVLLEMQNDSANDPSAVTAVEDDADLDFNAGKLEPVQAAVACSRSANFMDDTERLQDGLPSVSEEDNLNRDEPTEDHRAEITDNNDVHSVPDTSVDLNLGLCNTDNNDVINGVASQDIENNENNIQIVRLPSSEQMDLEEVRDCDDDSSKHGLSNEHDISSAQDNFGKDTHTPDSLQSGEHISSTATAWSQSEPFVLMPPSHSPSFDHQTNLEAPPLPPLPPMQWRLGKFRNFSSSPERHSAQERVGQAQVQPMPFPGVHHSLGPGLPMNLPAVHYTLAPVQPAVLPVHHTLLPVAQMPMPTLEHPNISIAQTSRNEGHTGSLDGYVVLPGGIAVPIATVGSQGFSQSDNSAVGRKEHLIFSVPSTSGYMPLQGEATMPILATTTGGSSQDNLLFSSPETVTLSQINTSASEGGPEDDDTSALNESIVPKTTEQETMSGSVRFQPMSPVHQPPAGFVATEAERTWLSTYDGAHTHTGNSTNGLLQKKLPRPRNPLIDEVVAIDKSKFRKVERVKPSLDSKSEEVESLLEQMQLRKVEKVKPPMETKVKEGGYKMEHFQLRKVGERVKPFAEPKHDESEFIPEQLQLRKVGERFKAEVEHKAEETDSPRVQLRKLSERVKPEVVPKTEETESPRIQLRKVGERVKQEIEARIEETESPRVQLRKVGENSQATVAPKVEERDSLLEQIRNKSFSLKPAVAARPNIQGPRTNLKVAAILEKASNIRQAMAGSDEDDDADTWE